MKKNLFTYMMSSKMTRKVLVSVIIIILLLASCVNSNEIQSPLQITADPTTSPSTTPTIIHPTQTPTFVVSTLTPKPTYDFYKANTTIKVTQGPVSVTTYEAPNEKYLYKYAYVTIVAFWREGINYLNLDDLNDNGLNNSDIIFDYSTGSGGTFLSLGPANDATYYYSDLHGMSFDSCLEHYPFTKMDPFLYTFQAQKVSSRRDYCVLTSEGHLSIIRFVEISQRADSDDLINLEFVVTTYKDVVAQAPTTTPGPSPTPSRYTGINLTAKQESALDLAAQSFLNAVASNDKEKVADLLEYPFYIDNENDKYPREIKDKAEFLAIYDGYFTPNIVNEFKDATVIDNMGIHLQDAISLIVKDSAVFFHPDGKIGQISNSSVWAISDNR